MQREPWGGKEPGRQDPRVRQHSPAATSCAFLSHWAGRESEGELTLTSGCPVNPKGTQWSQDNRVQCRPQAGENISAHKSWPGKVRSGPPLGDRKSVLIGGTGYEGHSAGPFQTLDT